MKPGMDLDEYRDIPIDDHYTDGRPDDESLISGRTLASTITHYRYENGRRYHAYRDGEYWQPNDEQSNNHEALVHHLMLLTLDNQLYLAPVENPTRIIDIGTGTGIWAIDMGDKFPDAEIIGTDLSPIQAEDKPPNVHFEVDDCVSEWTYPKDHFDMVHIRVLMGSIPDWPALYKQCFDHLAPGGYIEQVECSVHIQSSGSPLPPTSIFRRWTDAFYSASENFGKTMRICENMGSLIQEAGFVDVVEKRFRWPLGPWSSDPKLKEVGRWNLLNWEDGMEGWVMALYTRQLKWSYDEVQSFLGQIKSTLRDRKTHVWQECRVVYGRKPS